MTSDDDSLDAGLPSEMLHYCSVCGRHTNEASRGECAGCSKLFALPAGRGVYSPRTGKLWFRSNGHGTLVNPAYADRTPAVVDNRATSAAPYSLPWWLPFALAALIFYGCLHGL